MIRRLALAAAFLWIPHAILAGSETVLPLDGRIDPGGAFVDLNWSDATPLRMGPVSVLRRRLGQTGAGTWEPVAMLGPVIRFRDTTIRPGIGYEYQVRRTARNKADVGYWATGVSLPPETGMKTLYLVVDETVAGEIAPRLDRFAWDLEGDGWTVKRHLVARGTGNAVADLAAAEALRTWLRDQYFSDPFSKHAVVLLGRVPVVRSGLAAPDGHKSEPHASDLFYADMTGTWAPARPGILANSRVPDGYIEMQIGRIDFAGQSRERSGEIRLLRSYLDKNHHWRTGLLGDPRVAYGSVGHLLGETSGLRNIVGPGAVTTGGHHDTGEDGLWLWGVDFGNFNGKRYAADYANKAVFVINFGSGKQKFSRPFNALTASLAQPFYTVAAGWGGRPSWWLHHMALGGTIGDVHMRTANNGSGQGPPGDDLEYVPTGRYLWRNPVWVNLLGDPTLRAFPMSPPSGAVAVPDGSGVRVTWTVSPDPEVTGYHVYRREAGAEGFRPLTVEGPVTGTTFLDVDAGAGPGATYMVRATGLRHVHAGSFRTLSQGIRARPSPPRRSIDPAPLTLQVGPDGTAPLPDTIVAKAAAGQGGQVLSPLREPDRGRIFFNGTQWVYVPAEDWSGEVDLPVSIFDGYETRIGRLRLDIVFEEER